MLSTLITVTIEDLQSRYNGDLSTFDQTYLATQLADAQAFVDSMIPQVPVRTRNGRLSVTSYKRVICNMVLRVIRNPDGLQSENDGQYSYAYWHGAATGEMGITTDEATILTGMTGSGMQTVGIQLDAGWGG